MQWTGKQHVTCLKCNSTGKKKQKENIIKNIPSEHEIKLSEPSLAYATCPKNIISTNDVFLLYNVPPFDYKVFQVIDDNIILVEMPYISESKTIIAMVKLQSNHNYVDGEEIHEEHKLKYIGNRRYTTAVGSIKTVRYFEEMKLSKNNIKEN